MIIAVLDYGVPLRWKFGFDFVKWKWIGLSFLALILLVPLVSAHKAVAQIRQRLILGIFAIIGVKVLRRPEILQATSRSHILMLFFLVAKWLVNWRAKFEFTGFIFVILYYFYLFESINLVDWALFLKFPRLEWNFVILLIERKGLFVQFYLLQI